MKKAVNAVLFAVTCALIAAAPLVFAQLPVPSEGPPPKRDAEFRGILSVALAPTFSPGKGSFLPFVLQCAREFEKLNPGVLVRVEEITAAQLKKRIKEDINLPDVLVTGAGVLDAPEGLLSPLPEGLLAGHDEGLAERCSLGDTAYGVPVAMGAYGLIVNTAWMDRAEASPGMPPGELLEKLAAQGKKSTFTLQCPLLPGGLPQITLCQTLGALPDSAKGLPSDFALSNPTLVWPEFALDEKYAMYMGTQREVERLRVLRSGGRAFETAVVALTEGAWTDQLLYAGIIAHADENAARGRAAEGFAQMVSSRSMQEKLKNVGAFAVYPGVQLYDADASPDMRALEISLKDAVVPNVFGFSAVYADAQQAMRGAGSPSRAPLAAWQAVEFEE